MGSSDINPEINKDKFFEKMEEIAGISGMYPEEKAGIILAYPKDIYRVYLGALDTAVCKINEMTLEKIKLIKMKYSDKARLDADDIKKIKVELTDYIQNTVLKVVESKCIINIFYENKEIFINEGVRKLKKYCRDPVNFVELPELYDEYSDSETEKE